MKKMLFIYNPKAGKAQIRNKLADILDVFTKGGYEITVYPTQRSEDAMEKTEKRSKEYDIVVCSGGDGTLDEVVTGMIRSGFRTPIGYIPAGSTNDFGAAVEQEAPLILKKYRHFFLIVSSPELPIYLEFWDCMPHSVIWRNSPWKKSANMN